MVLGHPMVARGIATCSGFPSPTQSTVTESMSTCADIGGGDGWTTTIPWTGMTFGTFVLDVYRKMWKDAESEPSSFSFWKRVSSGSSTTENEPDIGSDGGGATQVEHRKYKLRVVNVATPLGGTPFCFSAADSNQVNSDDSAATKLCVV